MYGKWLAAHPKDVVWANLDDGAVEMRGRQFLSWVATVGLIILWAFPVAFIGTLSNLHGICSSVKLVFLVSLVSSFLADMRLMFVSDGLGSSVMVSQHWFFLYAL